jgi:hypothetical protein
LAQGHTIEVKGYAMLTNPTDFGGIGKGSEVALIRIDPIKRFAQH